MFFANKNMTIEEAYLGINKEIRKLEEKKIKYEESNKTNWILQLLLTVFTAGIWLIIYIPYRFLTVSFGKPSFYKELEELYELKDEAELKIKLKNI
jgi:hypothetical protein